MFLDFFSRICTHTFDVKIAYNPLCVDLEVSYRDPHYHNQSTHLTVTRLASVHCTRQDVAYIMWTGDNAPHDNWRTTREEVLSSTSTITALLRRYFPGVPVLPVIGNHDSAPINR